MKVLEIYVNTMRLYNGRRSLYVACEVLGKRFWFQRWDTDRAPTNRFRTKDGVMGWSWGRGYAVLRYN